ncbi:MAG: hypothetical protein AVDCRST_MAG19-4084, partial [uncultured Thermomicrobiales bacterium]
DPAGGGRLGREAAQGQGRDLRRGRRDAERPGAPIRRPQRLARRKLLPRGCCGTDGRRPGPRRAPRPLR